jgi:hypothetical protein
MWADGQTDMTNVMVPFPNFENAPKYTKFQSNLSGKVAEIVENILLKIWPVLLPVSYMDFF